MATDPNKAMQDILEGVEKRWHFSLADNILDYIPNNDDISAAVYDAADDINGFPPNTLMSFVDIYDHPDTRWKSLLYLATAKNVIQMLVNMWTQNGFDQTIGELRLENKLNDYKSLYDTLVGEFEKKAERVKKTTQKYVRGISSQSSGFGVISNYLYGTSPFFSVFNSRIRLR